MDRMTVVDDKGREIGYLDNSIVMDIDIGDTNDFEFEMDLTSWDVSRMNYNFMVTLPRTEYGGRVGDIQTITKNSVVKLTGDTWRGMLTKQIIEPTAGEEHLIVSGELNNILRDLIAGRLDGLFFVPQVDTGVSVNNFKFDRYCTLLSGMEDLLSSVGYRINIKYTRGGPGIPGWVEIQAVPVKDYSESREYNQDNRINFTARDYRRGINHLICAGVGEGADRNVLHLYMQKDGSIGDEKYYTGLDERVALYSYTSQSDTEQLKKDGAKQLQNLADYKEFDMQIGDVSLEIGDIVSGRDYTTGILVKRPVVQKILRIEKGELSTEYKLKGEK